MRKITREELISMISGDSKPNLSYVDLSYVDLSNLDLSLVDLRHANLYSANLSFANLSYANLQGVNLRNAVAICTILSHANLSFAVLDCVNLVASNLSGATLFGVSLDYANLSISNLSGANLFGTSLANTNLNSVDIKNVIYAPYIPMVCPEEGSFIGWKRILDKIIKLQIPAKAKRSSGTSRKCRCEFAKVLGIYTIDGIKLNLPEITNKVGNVTTIYKVGEYVYPDSFDDCRWNECTNGIHFFMNREEAIIYCPPIVPKQLFSKDRYVSKGETEKYDENRKS